ncbi:MAG: peptidoglycan DD-metalloendopeptidase family protein [Parcubacteria group bacterium]
MRLRNFLTVFFVSFFVLVLVVPQSGSGASPAELQREIEKINREREALVAEQRKLEEELRVVNMEAQTLGTAVKSLDATRRKLQADINITQSRISSTDLSISSLENSMTEKESQIITHRKAIATTLQALSEHGSRSLAFDLLASASLSDIWRDRGELQGLTVSLEEEINNLRETRSVLMREKEEKERVREEQARLQAELGGQKSVVEENQKAKATLLAETKNVEAEYQKMLAQNIARQKEFEEELFRIESELKIILDPTLIPSPRAGLLSWPLDNVFITQRFGRTSASGRLYASGTHNGIDFRAPQGTPIKAMLSGTVEGVGNTDEQKGCYSYGRWVLIKHSNGLSSIYAHMSAGVVKAGQMVSTGQVIGYSGGQPRVFGSGYSTGPHLHVGLFASQGVSIQQFTKSINCKQVFVPIADVKAYLDPLAYLPAL